VRVDLSKMKEQQEKRGNKIGQRWSGDSERKSCFSVFIDSIYSILSHDLEILPMC